MNLTITKVVRDDVEQKAFGFAADDEGQEFFLPRATIIRNDITGEDVGVDIEAVVRENPRPIAGKLNLPHVVKVEFVS